MTMSDLLIVGGAHDPSITALRAAAERTGTCMTAVLTGPNDMPVVKFDPQHTTMHINGRPAHAYGGAFLREDVFAKARNPEDQERYRAYQHAIHLMMRGWIAVAPHIRTFNRDDFGRSLSVNKLAALATAARVGLAIPGTTAGNDPVALHARLARGSLIQKPIAGGDYCRALDRATLERHRSAPIPPVTAQTRLVGPDIRVFMIGNRLMAFMIESAHLDYRRDPAARITEVPVPRQIAASLRQLAGMMRLDWCASDFKTCPKTGALIYLETNANPMFAAFDQASDGVLAQEILLQLVTRPKAGTATQSCIQSPAKTGAREQDAAPARPAKCGLGARNYSAGASEPALFSTIAINDALAPSPLETGAAASSGS